MRPLKTFDSCAPIGWTFFLVFKKLKIVLLDKFLKSIIDFVKASHKWRVKVSWFGVANFYDEQECFCFRVSHSSEAAVLGRLYPQLITWRWWFTHCHVWLSATAWIVPCQVPLSMGFSRQEYFPLGDLPDPGIEPGSPASEADSLATELRELKMWCLRRVPVVHGTLSFSLFHSGIYSSSSE